MADNRRSPPRRRARRPDPPDALFTAVFRHAPDALAIARQADGVILDVNEEFERLVDRPRADIVGQNQLVLGQGVRDADRAQLLAAVARGETIYGAVVPFRTPEGAEGARTVSARPIDVAGEACVLVSVRDTSEQHRAAEALRRSEARYRALIEDQTEFVVRWRPDGTRTFVNAAYCRYFGGTPADHVGSTFYPLIDPADRQRIRDKIAALSPERPVATDVHRVIRPDGSRGWNEWTDRALFDRDGRLVEMLSVGRDVSEQHEAQARLQDSEARFRTLAESAFEAIAVTRDGVIVDCNPQLAAMLGCAPEEMIGRPVQDFVAPADHSIVVDRIARQHRARYEHMARRQDGTEFPVEVQGRPLPGSPGLRVTAIRDITDRRQAEDALRRSEAAYRAAVDHATYGIYRSTPEGRFLMVNPALVAMLGYDSAEDLMAVDLGRDVYADPTERARLVRDSFGQEEIPGVESVWRRRDGKPLTVRLSGRPLRDETGGIECYEMIVQDVTLERQLENQLRQAQKMEAVGQLTTGIAHDFNNILAVVLANAQLLRTAPPEALGDGLREIEDAARQGATIVGRLLGFARRADLKLAPAQLDEVVRRLEPMLRRLIPKNIEVRVEIAEPVASARADASAVEQILINLVTNARDAMPDGGVLTLTAANDRLDASHRKRHAWIIPGEYVCLTVSDTGRGMDQQTLERIFEPFFTTKPTGAGTGLGLSMVYGLVKQQDGLVQVDSTPGAGTTVRLHFPAVADAPVAPAPTGGSRGIVGGTETVLLVDDEDALRRTGKRALESFGYTVLVARDGVEAMEVYQRHHSTIALIVSDLAMPRCDGWGLYRKLRDEGHDVKFIMASGHREADTRERLTIAATVAYLQKPWTLEALAGKIRQVLDGEA